MAGCCLQFQPLDTVLMAGQFCKAMSDTTSDTTSDTMSDKHFARAICRLRRLLHFVALLA
jgi:hypothetical protein